MKLVREHIFEEEEYKPKWIKGPTHEQVKARLEPKLKGMTLREKFDLSFENGVTWLIQECIDAGYDPSADDNWAIRLASYSGHLEVVKELLKDKRVDPSADDNWAISWASYSGHLEVVKELLKDKKVRKNLSSELKIKFKEFLK